MYGSPAVSTSGAAGRAPSKHGGGQSLARVSARMRAQPLLLRRRRQGGAYEPARTRAQPKMLCPLARGGAYEPALHMAIASCAADRTPSKHGGGQSLARVSARMRAQPLLLRQRRRAVPMSPPSCEHSPSCCVHWRGAAPMSPPRRWQLPDATR